MPKTFFQKNGFDVRVTIGTYQINTTNEKKNNGLCDQLIVFSSVNKARTAVISFIPPETSFTMEQYQGKLVKILIRTAATGWKQVFYGFVDTPELDFMARKIILNCSDNRSNRVIQLPLGVVNSIGVYSETIFGASKDRSDELEKRLQTVAADFDFDSYGNWHLTPWQPKATPDFTLTPGDVSNGYNPSLHYSNRVKTINTINLEINYEYQRLHQQTCLFNFSMAENFITDWFLNGKPTFPAKDTISSAAGGSDWKLLAPINFVNLWPAQGFSNNVGVVIWQPNQIQQITKQRMQFMGFEKDSTGNFILVDDPDSETDRLVPFFKPVLDLNGNEVYDVVSSTLVDTSSHLCIGATWASGLKFSQTIREKYTLQMKSPQSITKYGIIDSFESFTINAPFDTARWEKSDVYLATTENGYIDKKIDYDNLATAINVSLHKAKHDILELHRDVELSFRTKDKPRPEIDMIHTLDVTIDQTAIGDTASIHAIGRVDSIQHFVDFTTLEGYSTISLRLSRAEGSASDDPWIVSAPTEDASYIYEIPKTVRLGINAAYDPNSPPPFADKLTGWFANYTQADGRRTAWPENFIMDFPPIPDALRDDKGYSSEAQFDIEIPNDTLTLSF